MLDSISRKKSNLEKVLKSSRQEQGNPESNRASKDLRVIVDTNSDIISHYIVVKGPKEFWDALCRGDAIKGLVYSMTTLSPV